MVFPTRELETDHHNAQTFQAFFELWVIRQEHYLQELLQLIEHDGNSSGQEKELHSKELVNRVLVHYNEYFEAKARAVRENVFQMFMPPWLSSVERAYMWICGFRAGLAFRLVSNNVNDLTEDQSQMINTSLMEIKEEEKELTDELQRLEQGMISQSMVELARNMGRPQNGAAMDMDSAFEGLRASMETLVHCADLLRMKAVIKLMDTLKPTQAVRFLAAAAQLHLNIRRFGMQTDARIQRL